MNGTNVEVYKCSIFETNIGMDILIVKCRSVFYFFLKKLKHYLFRYFYTGQFRLRYEYTNKPTAGVRHLKKIISWFKNIFDGGKKHEMF